MLGREKTKMNDIESKLEKLEQVDGFVAAGAVDVEGKLLAHYTPVKKIQWDDICDISNKVLSRTQMLAGTIGIGTPLFVQITSSGGHILSQCLSDISDSNDSSINRIILFLAIEGNAALGKVKLRALAKEMSDF